MNAMHHLAIYGGVSLAGLAVTLISYCGIARRKNSDKRSAHIATLIRQGAMSFLRQE